MARAVARDEAMRHRDRARATRASLSSGRPVLARAVDATVRGAGPASAYQLTLQRFARAEHPHGGVVAGDADRGREVFHAHALDLDALHGVAVLGLERVR